MTVRGWCRSAIPLMFCAVSGLVMSLAGAEAAKAAMAPPTGLPALQAAAWTERLADALQPPRSGATSVYDAASNRVIVFGGASGAFLNDTWSLSFSGAAGSGTGTWTRLQTIGDTPTPRMWHSAIYDAAGNRMLVHGGYDGRVLRDTYSLDLATLTWRKFTASTRGLLAPRRYMSSTIARTDAVPGGIETSMLLFGGSDGDSLQNEFFQLVLTSPDSKREGAWVQYTTVATPRPSKRLGASLDGNKDTLYVVGGRDNNQYINDVWSLNTSLGIWHQDSASVNARPAGRFGSVVSFDPAAHALRLYGGADARVVYGDAWVLSGLGTKTVTWTPLDTTTATKNGIDGPEARAFAASVLLPSGDILVAGGMGANGMLGDSWRLPATGSAWQGVSLVTNPAPRYGHAMAYDPIRDRVFMFGGLSSFGETLNGTWTYAPSTQTWARLALQDSLPAPRARAAAVYAQDSVWVFGGWRGSYARRGSTTITDFTYSDSMSVFSLATGKWRRVVQDGARPAGRDGASMVYDAARNRLLVFGGYNGVYLADMWAFDLTTETWIRLPDFGGTGRNGHVAAIDPGNTRMLVFGGASATGLLNDVRVFDLVTNLWQTAPVVTGTPPSARLWSSAFVDAGSNSLVLLGGASLGSATATVLVPVPAGGAFTLDLSTYAWSALTVNGPAPAARYQSPIVTTGTTAILFAGSDGGSTRSDTWHLSLTAPAPASATTTVTAEGAVTVRWETTQNSILGYAVVRESLLDGSTPAVVAKVMASEIPASSAWAEAADLTAAGGAFRYTVVNMATGARIPAGEVVVPSASTPRAELVALRAQSPARFPAKIQLVGFAGAAQASVPLRVFDVTGRHVRDLSLASDGSLTRTATWDGRDDAGREVRSGIYLLRTTVDATVRQTRIAIVR